MMKLVTKPQVMFTPDRDVYAATPFQRDVERMGIRLRNPASGPEAANRTRSKDCNTARGAKAAFESKRCDASSDYWALCRLTARGVVPQYEQRNENWCIEQANSRSQPKYGCFRIDAYKNVLPIGRNSPLIADGRVLCISDKGCPMPWDRRLEDRLARLSE